MSTAESFSAIDILASRTAFLYAEPWLDGLLDSIGQNIELVVDLQSQTIYWLGTRFEPDFTPSAWNFFAKLVHNTKVEGRGVDLIDFEGRRRLSHAGFRTKKKRLTDQLESCALVDLANRIVPFDNGYQLKVTPSEICIHPDLQPPRPFKQFRICA